MKILLINPPPRKKKRFNTFIIPPIGLSYLAPVLEKKGFDVNILDANALQFSWEDLEDYLENYGKVDVIGIGTMTPIADRAFGLPYTV